MYNELLFLTTTIFIGITALWFSRYGQPALVAYVCLLPILANIFVLKQIPFLGMIATCTDPLIIGSTLGLNLIQEQYGNSAARNTVAISFMLLLFYTIITQLMLTFTATVDSSVVVGYSSIFSLMPRITIASLCAYGIAQCFDYLIYGWLKKRYHTAHQAIRSALSISCSQFIDTILFTIIGLYGVVPHLQSIITVSYTIKLLSIGIAVTITNYLLYSITEATH